MHHLVGSPQTEAQASTQRPVALFGVQAFEESAVWAAEVYEPLCDAGEWGGWFSFVGEGIIRVLRGVIEKF
jgi:hypothetical protein